MARSRKNIPPAGAETPTIGDLISNRTNGRWLGFIVLDDPRMDCFKVLVIRNKDYPDQVGKICQWSKSCGWKIIAEGG